MGYSRVAWQQKALNVLLVVIFLLTPLPNLVTTPSVAVAQDQAAKPVFAYYYLWWTQNHWENKLGPNYPYDASPLPLPATLDENGCNPVSLYDGNTIFDVPTSLHIQDEPGVIEQDVREAAAAGLPGFLVGWNGEGTSTQTPTSSGHNRRLQLMFDAVNQVNSEGIPFKIWLGYRASSSIKDATVRYNDINYLKTHYGDSPALDKSFNERPILIWIGSRKYPVDEIQITSQQFRDTFFIIGDEKDLWGDGREQYLDGATYYWSSQNPYSNPHSFSQLQELGDQVHNSGPNPDGSRKLWLSPLAAGYNHLLGGGSSCTPRNNGETLDLLYQGNLASNPDGWAFISWNEIAEGTHIKPMQRWGDFYLNKLVSLTSPQPTPTAIPTETPFPTETPLPTPTHTPVPTVTPTDTTPPIVDFTAPRNGSIVRRYSIIRMSANASDDVGIDKVRFYYNNTLLCTDSSPTYACIWRLMGNYPSYTFTAEAVDTSGNVSTDTTTVFVR